MNKEITEYHKAIMRISLQVNSNHIDSFKGSEALAICFGRSKEEALEDLLRYRRDDKLKGY